MLSTAALLLLSITALIVAFHLHHLSTEIRELRGRMNDSTDKRGLIE